MASTLRAGETKINPCLPQLSCPGDINTGTPRAAVPGVWCYRVSALTGWLSVSIL